jgi:hypothetical protein
MEFESFVASHTRPQIEFHLASAKARLSEEAYKQEESQIWLAYARRERPQRTVRVLLDLIDKAQHQRKSSYKDVREIIGTDAHNENMVIIKAIGEICKTYRWPPYAVLIKTETGNVGSGFFKDYGFGGSPIHLTLIEGAMDQLCFHSKPPEMIEVAEAVKAHFAK